MIFLVLLIMNTFCAASSSALGQNGYEFYFSDPERMSIQLCHAIVLKSRYKLGHETKSEMKPLQTRMHSSRMRTVRCSSHLGGGVSMVVSAWHGGGMSTQGGCLPGRGLSAWQGDVCLAGGVSAWWWGVCPGGCLPGRGYLPGECKPPP